MSVLTPPNPRSELNRPPVTTVMTQAVARLLLAPSWMVAAATLVKGYADTGDGFSAGVIASLGIVVQYVVFGHEEVERRLPVHHAPMVAVVGLLLGLAIAFGPLLFGEPALTYWPPAGEEPAHLGSLELIGAVAFDLAVFMIVLGVCVGAIDLIAHAQRSYRRRSP